MHINSTIPRTVPAARVRRGAILAVTALACAALISACGSSSTTSTTTAAKLDTARVAASIEGSVLSERHLHVKVTCPSAVPQEKGKTFVCTATGHTVKTATKPSTVVTTPFTVTVESDKGYVEYKGE